MSKTNGTYQPNGGGYDKETLERVSSLVDALLDDRVPRRTKRKLQEWFRSPASEGLKYDLLEDKFQKLEPNLTPDEYEYEQLEKMKRLLGMIPEEHIELKPKNRVTPAKWAMRVAAVVLPLFILGSVWFWMSHDNIITYPETNIAVVADDNLVKKIELPDGSEVWINKGGEIAYSDDFSSERFLTINGEAYFKVVKNAQKPFIVKAKELIVEVTGTEFNFKSYDTDQDAEVLLVKGSVEVATLTKGKEQRYTMVPGDQLTIDKTGHIEVKQLPEQNISQEWIKPSLLFDNTPLREALQNVSTYFQKQILIDSTVSHGALINLQFDNEMTLEQIMDVLENVSGAFSYKIESDTITITAR